MASNSDTESEPDSLATPNPFLTQYATGHDAGQQTVSDAITEIEGIELDTLAQVKFRSQCSLLSHFYSKDTSVHEIIAIASDTILAFLDELQQTPFTERRLQKRLFDFSQLCKDVVPQFN